MQFSTFAWANKEHRFVVSSNKGIHNEYLDLSRRDYIPKTISKPNIPHIGKPIYGVYSQIYALPIGYGVIDRRGNYLGAVITSFIIEGMKRKIENTINKSNIRFILMQDPQTYIIADDEIDYNDFKKSFKDYDEIISRSNSGFINKTNIFQRKNYGTIYFKKFDRYPFIIIMIYDKEAEEAIKHNMVSDYSTLFSSLCCFLLIITIFFYRHLVKPIVEISKSSEKIAKKEYNKIKKKSYSNYQLNQLSKTILSIKNYIKEQDDLKEELKLSYKKSDDKNKQLQNLLKITSHDLKNYINTTLNLSIEILEDKYVANNEHIKENAELILTQSEEMLDFIQDLLDINLIENNIEVNNNPYSDLKENIDKVILLNRYFIKENEVTVEVDIEKKMKKIFFEKRKLKQLLHNILTNSVKYSKKNSLINISAKKIKNDKDDYDIYLEIKDRGIGMTKSELKKAISGQGKEIDKSDLDKENIHSHGIGMTIIHKILNENDVKYEIDSARNRGTTFRIWFCTKKNKKI